MAKYIDKQVALRHWPPCDEPADAYQYIKNFPAADVRPVVLCRDCKQYGGRPWENNESGICARTDCGVGEDDFCSYGEKLEES